MRLGSEVSQPKLCAVYVDMGTTNTRVWLMDGDQVIATANRAVGIRDVARDRFPTHIHATLRELIGEVCRNGAVRAQPCTPRYLAASGMITSSLGLAEIPHVQAPAGIAELAAASEWKKFPDLTDLPVLLVPGIRSGGNEGSVDSALRMDVMRGEVTLVAGLLQLGLVQMPATVLNLGSHWKAIEVNAGGRIASSITSLSGELIHALQTQTILADSVSSDRTAQLAERWIQAGIEEQRRSGLPRALFCVRLLDLSKQGSRENRIAFLIGATIAADMDALLERGFLRSDIPVAVVGHAALAEAWRAALTRASLRVTVIAPSESEKALLTALRQILVLAIELDDKQAVGQEHSR